MKLAVSTVLSVLLLTTVTFAQKHTTIMGDAWKGVVESADEATREVKVVGLDKKTETFTGVLQDGYQVKMKDGTSRELKMSDFKPGLRVRLWYKSKTQDVAGQRTKVNLINRVQFLGRDEYTGLRELLKVAPSIPVSKAETDKLPTKDPFKLFLALDPQNLDKALFKWADDWNKFESAKHGRVEIVADLAQADASLVVIWGDDDGYMMLPALMGYNGSDLRDIGFGTAYLVNKNDSELRLLWQDRIALDMKEPERTGPYLGQQIGKKLKARSK